MQPCQIQNRRLFRTGGIYKILSNMEDDPAYSKPWHSHKVLCKYFEGYFGKFRDTDAYSVTLTGLQLRRRVKASLVFFENRKNSPEFGKKDSDCIHYWVKISIRDVVLRVFRRNGSLRGFFSSALYKIFIEVSQFHPRSSMS